MQSISITREKTTPAIASSDTNIPAPKTGAKGHHGNLHTVAITITNTSKKLKPRNLASILPTPSSNEKIKVSTQNNKPIF
jgi:hypothetical protein